MTNRSTVTSFFCPIRWTLSMACSSTLHAVVGGGGGGMGGDVRSAACACSCSCACVARSVQVHGNASIQSVHGNASIQNHIYTHVPLNTPYTRTQKAHCMVLVQTHRHTDTQTNRRTDEPKHYQAHPQAHPQARLHGCTAAWLHGCMVARLTLTRDSTMGLLRSRGMQRSGSDPPRLHAGSSPVR